MTDMQAYYFKNCKLFKYYCSECFCLPTNSIWVASMRYPVFVITSGHQPLITGISCIKNVNSGLMVHCRLMVYIKFMYVIFQLEPSGESINAECTAVLADCSHWVRILGSRVASTLLQRVIQLQIPRVQEWPDFYYFILTY